MPESFFGEWSLAVLPLLAATVRVSTPLLFAAMGGLLSERAGVINIALEGMMIVGAFSAAVFTLVTHSPWLGWVGASLGGASLGAVYAFVVIKLRANQIVAGTAINMLALGIPPFISKVLYGHTGSTPSIPLAERFHGTPIGEPIWMAWILVALVAWALARTPAGLWVRFAGEHPHALDAAGVRVNRVRWFSVILGGALAGLGGATLSILLASSYSRGMTAGRGFMAIAALIFGKWKPWPTAFACLFFGFADALQIRLQGVVLWGEEPVPVQFIQILPYVVTVLVLAGLVGRSQAPKALGQSFDH